MIERQNETRHSRLAGWEWLLITLILLAGWLLRVAQFDTVPPGVSHDEVFDWYNAELVNQGDIRALYPYGGGREALYILLVTLTFNTMGSNLIALRFPALLIGMIGIATTYTLVRRLLGRTAAVFAAAGLATAYWALTFSRLGERTGSAPMMGLLAFYIFTRFILHNPQPKWWHYVISGIMLAVALYTYPAALMLPAIFATWLLLIVAFRREWLAGKWIGLAAMGLAFALAVSPLARGWLDPNTAVRADAVNAPLEALLAGDPAPILANIPPVLGMLTIQGDTGVDVNNEGLPVFPTLLMQIFFYLGLLIAAVRTIQPRRAGWAGFLLILIWLPAMMIPTLVTQRALNPSRTIGMLGVAFIFPAVAVAVGYAWLRARGQLRLALSTLLIGVLMVVIQAQHTTLNYFTLWPQNEVMRFWYQPYYTAMAAEINSDPDPDALAIGGLTPYLMDSGSLLLLVTDDQYANSIGFFESQNSLLIPYSQGSAARIFVPKTVPLHGAINARLDAWGIAQQAENDEYWTLNASHADLPAPLPDPTRFGDGLIDLIALDRVGEVTPGQAFTLTTVWEIQAASPEPLRIFVHLIAPDGSMLSQSDVLGAPAVDWREGDVLIQAHDMLIPVDAPPGTYIIRIGLYNPETNTRLASDAPSGDFVELMLP